MRIKKGFTVVEILVATTLSIVFSLMIARSINSGVELNVETNKRIIAENKARDAFRNITTAMRGTIPLGKCEIPKGETITQKCIKILYENYPIISASTDSIAFFSRNRSSSYDNSHPNLFRVRLCTDNQNGCSINLFLLSEYRHEQSVDEYVNAKASWNMPCLSINCPHFSGSADNLRIGEIDISKQSTSACGQKEIFRYYDDFGRRIQPTSNCFLSAQDLTKIKLVVMEANFSYGSPFDINKENDQPILKTFPVKAVISLPSKSYGTEK